MNEVAQKKKHVKFNADINSTKTDATHSSVSRMFSIKSQESIQIEHK